MHWRMREPADRSPETKVKEKLKNGRRVLHHLIINFKHGHLHRELKAVFRKVTLRLSHCRHGIRSLDAKMILRAIVFCCFVTGVCPMQLSIPDKTTCGLRKMRRSTVVRYTCVFTVGSGSFLAFLRFNKSKIFSRVR
jgi:hypothetical protein